MKRRSLLKILTGLLGAPFAVLKPNVSVAKTKPAPMLLSTHYQPVKAGVIKIPYVLFGGAASFDRPSPFRFDSVLVDKSILGNRELILEAAKKDRIEKLKTFADSDGHEFQQLAKETLKEIV